MNINRILIKQRNMKN